MGNQTSPPLQYPVLFLRAKLKKRECPPPTPAANPPTPSVRVAPSNETPSRQERRSRYFVVSLVTHRSSLRKPRTRSLRATLCIDWKRLRRRIMLSNIGIWGGSVLGL